MRIKKETERFFVLEHLKLMKSGFLKVKKAQVL